VVNNWIKQFPEEPGWYWFYGVRYRAKDGYPNREPELYTVKVNAINNGFTYVANGQFMYESEVGDYRFCPMEVPDTLPEIDINLK
jgi:hypothetical protein